MKPNPGETQGQSGQQGRETALYGICHGDFNQHNVLFAHGKIIITNFEQAHYDVLVGDLAHFLRKLMEKHNFNIGLATDMLAAYEKTKTITRGMGAALCKDGIPTEVLESGKSLL